MIYRPANRPNRLKRWWFGLLILPLLALWWWWAWFAALAASLVRPLWSLGEPDAATLNSATLRLPVLEAEVSRLTADNAALRQALGRRPDPAERPLLGRVISHPRVSPYDTLVVDLGAANASPRPNLGNAVLVDGTFIGTVSAVGPTTVQIELAAAAGREWPARIGEKVPIVARGRGAGNFSAEVAAGLAVTPGEPVTLIMNEQTFNLGVVDRTEAQAGGSLETIYFRLPLNLDELDWVEIHAR